MRVISGRCRGTHLEAPEGMNTRPTTDRIKETLFNMIAFDIPECEFLDLFSGSGAMAIEALSRGGKRAVLVEKDTKALACIEQNLEKTRLKAEAKVVASDVFEALKRLEGEQFDIIFMDPPYALENILERSTKTIVKLPQNLVLWKEKQYKTTTLSFIRRDMGSE